MIDLTTGHMPTLALRTLLLAPELTALRGVRVTSVLSASAGRMQSGKSRHIVQQDGGREQRPKHAPESRRDAR